MIDDEAIAELLQGEFPDAAAVYRFGSTAAGGEHPGSDIDVAFLPSRAVDPLRRFEVQERLAALVHRDVDLVDLLSASTVLQMQVVSSGRLLRTLDEVRRGLFEDYVFASYARLNEERRGILERVAREGSVYGG